MTRTCAYCGSPSSLTREHIWPKCIINRVNYDIRITPRGKYISGELTIADVCSSCNNKVLARLDNYICKLYDEYFYQFHDRGSEVEFHYDWQRLGNWFLKASYNSARSAGNKSDTDILSQFTSFIRGIDLRQLDVAMWVDLVEPSFIVYQTESGVNTDKKLLPAMTRLAKINIPNANLQRYTIRMVAINSFYFYIVIPIQPYMMPCMSELKVICDFFSPMSQLDPDLTYVTVKTTGLAVQDTVIPYLEHNKAEYYRYLDQDKK